MQSVLSVEPYYRFPSDPRAFLEDRFFVNLESLIFGVADGASAAYSPKNPPKKYWGMSSGQMVVKTLGIEVNRDPFFRPLEECLLWANTQVRQVYQDHMQDPVYGQDVGGASFAFCQPIPEGLHVLLGGDCSVCIKAKKSKPLFYTGFDKAAFAMEAMDQNAYTEQLEKANSHKGDAWDGYHPYYKKKRIFCANKNIGKGGYATLNGDPALKDCWSSLIIPWSLELQEVNLITDGLLPPSEVDPDTFPTLAVKITDVYSLRGKDGLVEWRDTVEAKHKKLTHVEGHPEGTLLVLKFA